MKSVPLNIPECTVMIKRRRPGSPRSTGATLGSSRAINNKVKYRLLSNAGGATPVAMETERELKDRFDAVRERADALRRHL
jgi:hypothetical protein